MNIHEIENKYDETIKIIKEYCYELMKFSETQKDKWNLIPDLAKKANGIGGYNDSLSVCTQHKIWRIINSVSNGFYTFCVDCTTGKIKYQNYDICLDKVSNDFLFDMLSININDINCDIISEKLKNKIRRGFLND